MSTIRNHNYQIGTDELATGQIKAKARGRKTNAQTFPAGTTHEAAALALAAKIEGNPTTEVRELSRNDGGTKRDFAIYTTRPDIAPADEAEVRRRLAAAQATAQHAAEVDAEAKAEREATDEIACASCGGTGTKPYASAHPQCSRCYGTGIEGMTMTRLEAEAKLAAEAKRRELQEDQADGIGAVLYHFTGQGRIPGGFACSLMETMGKADRTNLARLIAAFPEYGVPFDIAAHVEGGTAALQHALRLADAAAEATVIALGREGLMEIARRIAHGGL